MIHYPESAEALGRDYYIYIIGLTNKKMIKIGRTKHLRHRIAAINRTGKSLYGSPVEVLGVIRGRGSVERQLHIRFHKYSIAGMREWFRWHDSIASFAASEFERYSWVPTKNMGGARMGAGRPRTIGHMEDYSWCMCVDCRKARSKSA